VLQIGQKPEGNGKDCAFSYFFFPDLILGTDFNDLIPERNSGTTLGQTESVASQIIWTPLF
jgi:hypothetical protein